MSVNIRRTGIAGCQGITIGKVEAVIALASDQPFDCIALVDQTVSDGQIIDKRYINLYMG